MIWTLCLPVSSRRASILSSNIILEQGGAYGPNCQIQPLSEIIITKLRARLTRAEVSFVPYDSRLKSHAFSLQAEAPFQCVSGSHFLSFALVVLSKH